MIWMLSGIIISANEFYVLAEVWLFVLASFPNSNITYERIDILWYFQDISWHLLD